MVAGAAYVTTPLEAPAAAVGQLPATPPPATVNPGGSVSRKSCVSVAAKWGRAVGKKKERAGQAGWDKWGRRGTGNSGVVDWSRDQRQSAIGVQLIDCNGAGVRTAGDICENVAETTAAIGNHRHRGR